MAKFMVTIIAQTAIFTFRPVIRSSVIPNEVLLHTAARIASDPEQLLSREIATRLSLGSISVTWWPKPKDWMLMAVMIASPSSAS